MTEKPPYSVSVVIPAYNVGEYIARTLDSVLNQTHPADEIIIVDDGSTDNTAEVVRSYGSKVKFIQQGNAGASAARNAGVKAARSEWIAFLDGDDEWLVDKLELQMALLERNPDLVWTTGNFHRCLCKENRCKPDISPNKAARLMQGKNYLNNYFTGYMKGLGGWTGTMVIKRSVLEQAGLFREGQWRANDLDMWWRIAHRWPRIGYVPEPLAIYHMGTAVSISQGRFDVDLHCELIERHLKFAKEAGSLLAFKPYAVWSIRRWIRAMLFYQAKDDIRRMMNQFDELLPGGYKLWMRFLTAYPSLTGGVCHIISRVIRTFNLRRRVARRPKKNDDS